MTGPRCALVPLDGYAYSHTAASALRSMGASERLDRWCAAHGDEPSAPWICQDQGWSTLWPELRER